MGQKRLNLSRYGVYFAYSVDLVPEKFYPYRVFIGVSGVNLDRVSPYPEFITHKVNIVAFVLQFNKLVQKLVAVFLHSHSKGNHHIFIVDWVT